MNAMKTHLRMNNKTDCNLIADYKLSDVISLDTESLYNDETKKTEIYYRLKLSGGYCSFGIERWFVSFY